MALTVNDVVLGIACIVVSHALLEIVSRFAGLPGPESAWSYAATCVGLLAGIVIVARSKKVSDAR